MQRQWIVDGAPVVVDPELEEEFEDAAAQAFFEAKSILDRIGGAFVITRERVKLGEDMYEPGPYIFRWHSYGGPAKGEPQPEEKAEENGQPEETPVPIEGG